MTMTITPMEAAEAKAAKAEEHVSILLNRLQRQAQQAHDLYTIVKLAHEAVEAHEALMEALPSAEAEHLSQHHVAADLVTAVSRIRDEFQWREF